ncbi:hypothetical protein XELAEV_18010140mg [Xenopus laevis]|uniref:Uncharacterized protein n=1 Tax=Xenopus laevis TaxID=8355 RepID=A0A974DVR1_XENLA|nr:hypothetical protein XELAEV_18010140mg [Xenopus laevis]
MAPENNSIKLIMCTLVVLCYPSNRLRAQVMRNARTSVIFFFSLSQTILFLGTDWVSLACAYEIVYVGIS